MPALPKMCVNEWAGKEEERRKKEIRENESSQAQCQPSQYQYTIWLVSVRLCYNAIFMGGANNFLYPFGRFLNPILRRTSLPPSHRNHQPPPGASVRSTFIVYMALKYFPVSVRFYFKMWYFTDYIVCVKTLPFLWCNEISLGCREIILLPVSKSTWLEPAVYDKSHVRGSWSCWRVCLVRKVVKPFTRTKLINLKHQRNEISSERSTFVSAETCLSFCLRMLQLMISKAKKGLANIPLS